MGKNSKVFLTGSPRAGPVLPARALLQARRRGKLALGPSLLT